MMRPHAVLFDMDGTLIDSHDYWYAVVCEASERFGGGPVERAQFNASFGQSSAADVAEFFPKAALSDVDHFYNHALPRHVHQLRRMDGAMALLHALKAAAIPVACVTNAPSLFTRAALEAVGMLPLFTALACADEVSNAKPAPDMLLLAAQRLGVSVETCVFVGDSRFDVLAGRAAGCRVVGLGIPADHQVSTLFEAALLLLD